MATFRWNGGGGTWSDPSGWTVLSGVGTTPGVNDDVTIDAPLNYGITISGVQAARDVMVNATGAHLSVVGQLAVQDLSLVSGSFSVAGTLAMSGTLALLGGGFSIGTTGILQGGTVSGPGYVFGADSGTLDGVTVLGTLDESGVAVFVKNGLTILGQNGAGVGALRTESPGNITFLSSTTLDNVAIDPAGLTLTANGTLTFAKGVTITETPFKGITFSGPGQITNYGTILLGVNDSALPIHLPVFDNEGVITFSQPLTSLNADGDFINGGRFSGDWAYIAGTLSGSGVFAANLVNAGTIAAGVDIVRLGGGLGISAATISPQATIEGFIKGGVIDITGTPYTFNTNAFWSGTINGGTLIIKDGATTTAQLYMIGIPNGTQFTVSPDSNVTPGIIISSSNVACFAAGTRIATRDGEVPVEDLRAGDRVRSAFGGDVPVEWIGRRTLRAAGLRNPSAIYPVRIAASAITPGVPARDLLVSPDHALYLDGVLVPAVLLVNGSTIVRVPVEEVTYFHLELPQHDVILAEGALCESYLDTGNRGDFDNAPPDVPADEDANVIWLSSACAPQCRSGTRLEAIRATLSVVSSMLRVQLVRRAG